MQNYSINFPSQKALIAEQIFNILDRVPQELRTDVLLMVGKTFGLSTPQLVLQSRTTHGVPKAPDKKILIKQLQAVKQKLSQAGRRLPPDHPLVAQRDDLLRRIAAGRHSFRCPQGRNDSCFYEAWPEEETSEENDLEFYNSDGDDSVNRVGY